jgi:hypothetical protein
MRAITDPLAIARYQGLVDEMTVSNGTYEREFDQGWLRDHGWRVVPVASEISHFSPEEIDRIVPALSRRGYRQCFAVATEPLDPLPLCYEVEISGEDFRRFNRECALLRYLLTDSANSWALSCYGGYKLFAGTTLMLEQLLGEPIELARKKFLEFAQSIEPGSVDTLLLKMASRYADM